MDAFGSVLQPMIIPSQPIGYEVSIASDPKKIDVYFDMVLKRIKSRFDGKEIRSIEVIESDLDPRVTFIINENPEHRLTFKPKDYWGKLVDVARDGYASSDDAQGVADYFNTNRTCRLYTKTKKKNFGYIPTRLLAVDADTLRPASGVQIKMKTGKTIARRKKRNT